MLNLSEKVNSVENIKPRIFFLGASFYYHILLCKIDLKVPYFLLLNSKVYVVSLSSITRECSKEIWFRCAEY